MNRVHTTVCAMLLTSAIAMGQGTANQTQPANAPGQQPAQAQAPAQPAAPAPAPGRKLPEAKSQAEFADYQKTVAIADMAQYEAAVDEFAKKYPNSELRELAFNRAMFLAQQANDADKAVEYGRKVLQISPNDPVASMMVATNLSERTRDTDLDKDQKLAEATQSAENALKNVETNMLFMPGATPEQIAANKELVRSGAYSALAQVALVKSDYATGEKYLRLAAEQSKVNAPDPIIYLRLALTLDRQKKYQDGLVAANKAFELAPAGSQLQTLAKQERERLLQLIGGSQAKPAAPASTNTPTPQ